MINMTKQKIFFTGCLDNELEESNTYQVNWYDGSIKNISMKSFVFILDFNEEIYLKYKYMIDNNKLNYLNLTSIINERNIL